MRSTVQYHIEQLNKFAGDEKHFPIVLHTMKKDWRVDLHTACAIAHGFTGRKVYTKIKAWRVCEEKHTSALALVAAQRPAEQLELLPCQDVAP